MLNRRQHLRRIAAFFAAIMDIFGPRTEASQQSLVELTLPREPAHDEVVWLQIQTGMLPHGAVVTVTSTKGELLGSAAPYGSARGVSSTSYLVPLPESAIINGRIRFRLMIEQPGQPGRAPRPDEVETVVPVYVPVTK
jgi:hypothetical protein